MKPISIGGAGTAAIPAISHTLMAPYKFGPIFAIKGLPPGLVVSCVTRECHILGFRINSPPHPFVFAILQMFQIFAVYFLKSQN